VRDGGAGCASWELKCEWMGREAPGDGCTKFQVGSAICPSESDGNHERGAGERVSPCWWGSSWFCSPKADKEACSRDVPIP